MSNDYQGWGGEDDDLFYRIKQNRLLRGDKGDEVAVPAPKKGEISCTTSCMEYGGSNVSDSGKSPAEIEGEAHEVARNAYLSHAAVEEIQQKLQKTDLVSPKLGSFLAKEKKK
jgi:hypothetical protein